MNTEGKSENGHRGIDGLGDYSLEPHDLENPDEIHELRKRLHAQGYRHVLSLYPIFWDDPNDQSATVNSVS